MKALVYNGPGNKAVEERPKPEIATPTDTVIRLTSTTICGTDLHILKGDVPSCTPGPAGEAGREAAISASVSAIMTIILMFWQPTEPDGGDEIDSIAFIHEHVADSHRRAFQFFALNQINSLTIWRPDVRSHPIQSIFAIISLDILQVNMSSREVIGIRRVSNDAAMKRWPHIPDLIFHRVLLLAARHLALARRFAASRVANLDHGARHRHTDGIGKCPQRGHKMTSRASPALVRFTRKRTCLSSSTFVGSSSCLAEHHRTEFPYDNEVGIL
jgi:hypothetical protein